MSRIIRLVTILITGFSLTLAGIVAGPAATAIENDTVRVSLTFPSGSSILTNAQKATIRKAVAIYGMDATFLVTGTAGKLPGVSDMSVRSLAKKRAKAVKSYLVKLGVKKSNVTTSVKISKIGIVLENRIVRSFSEPTLVTPSTPATTSVSLTCATGGTCAVGDVGPGGGTIYYVDNSPSGFNCGPTMVLFCHYLEVAPNGWSTGTDPLKVWATGDSLTGNSVADVLGLVEFNSTSSLNVGSQIGLGYQNSVAIVTQNNDVLTVATIAAGAARAYTGNSKTDWYLPTTAELNLLCQWNRGVPQVVTTRCTLGAINGGTGASSAGFQALYYWSSSEQASSSLWIQSFADGDQTGYAKDGERSVRPIRAF